MSRVTITNRLLSKLKPDAKPYFLRDGSLKGFGIKINPSGAIKYVAEVWCEGRSVRKTLGEYPVTTLQDAKRAALKYISEVKSGQLEDVTKKEVLLGTLFEDYVKHGRLKPRTIKDYREAVSFYLHDWLKKPVDSIDKQMVEERFYKIRDKGIAGGIPTYSQATKTMRILSALMNYAMADEVIHSNPVQVLKLKRVDRSIRKRENYLPATKVRELIEGTAQDAHPMTLAVQLMLCTGLRKNEALRLKWSDIEQVEGISCIIIKDTKNGRAHYVPVTQDMQKVLERASSKATYIFPSSRKKDCPISTERPTLKRLSKMIQQDFRCHDLRRTFATRASEVGIEYLTIKRLLNHKSNDITSQYIQWNSRDNLLVMKEALEKVQY